MSDYTDLLDAVDVGLMLIAPPDDFSDALAQCPPGSDGFPSAELLDAVERSRFLRLNAAAVEMTRTPDSDYFCAVLNRWFFKTSKFAAGAARVVAQSVEGTTTRIVAAVAAIDGRHGDYDMEFSYFTTTAGEPRFLLTSRDITHIERLLRSQREYQNQLRLILQERRADIADTTHSVHAVAGLVVSLVALRDEATAAHMKAVAETAAKLAERLGLEDRVQARLHAAGMMHNVGMLGVPADLLSKQAPLSAVEDMVLKEHARIGAELLAESGFEHEIVDTVLHHHERWDGTGYPDGLIGEAIGIEARILAVADAIEQIRRQSRTASAKTVTKSIVATLAREAGKGLDPQVAEVATALVAEKPEG